MKKSISYILLIALIVGLVPSLSLSTISLRAVAAPLDAPAESVASEEAALTANDFPMAGAQAEPAAAPAAVTQQGNGTCGRTVFADVVALDQPFYYNRLGAINANGMMYALARDVVTTAQVGAILTGTVVADLAPAARAGLEGFVALREDKRPRPIVLRMNEQDCLEINFTNLLDPDMFIFNLQDLGDFPTQPILGLGVPIGNQVDNQPLTRDASIHVDGLHLAGDIGSDGSNVGANASSLVAPGDSTTYTYYAAHTGTHLAYSMGSTLGGEGTGGTRAYGLFGAVNVQPRGAEWYRSQLTRQEMDFATTGFTPGGHPILNYDATYPVGEFLAAPLNEIQTITNDATGGTFTLSFGGDITVALDYNAPATGPGSVEEALAALPSIAAGNVSVTGGPQNWTVEFTGGLVAADQPQLVADDTLLTGQTNGTTITEVQAGFAGTPNPFFDTGKEGLPIVAMLAPKAGYDGELVHTDINAVITGPDRGVFGADTRSVAPPLNDALGDRTKPYREFTVIFHDEAIAVQAFPGFYNDPVLKHTLHSVRDSFPINYGSGGIGSEIIANRLGVGPMWDCAECKYEEFFLTSNTVGDPAMIVDIPANFGIDQTPMQVGPKATMALYPDDPSNVHHSYLNDRVIFRNLHAGPKEHHVFHLHAHQWLFNPDDPQSNYLDGQAIGPGSGYSYEIAYGGSGNRNKTAGDSIFHCHFYPHFAQGMWEMWRVHDVFEQGTVLDAAAVAANPAAGKPAAGARALPDGEIVAGTPIPGVVPLPKMAMAPMPDAAATIVASDLNGDTIPDSSQWDVDGNGIADWEEGFPAGAGFPGYPFYIPGVMGHRPPTPALDLAFDGGLPRHIVISGPDEFNDPATPGPDAVVQYQTRLDFNKILHHATALGIPEGGTPAEIQAMNFHAGPDYATGGGDPYYPSLEPDGVTPADFEVNGLLAAAGAPYADPCRTDVTAGVVTATGTPRTIKGANIEMPITLNRVGWHFQQQRFEALWQDVGPTLMEAKAPEPMIMRMNSKDCGEFQHTNLVPNVYQLDDYQVRTPTDIIGQHIHLVKFDVMSADGSANGWNYEDGTLSPDEVRERIHAFNDGGGFEETDGTVRSDANGNPLHPAQHPWFSENTFADYDHTTGTPFGANIYVCAEEDALGNLVPTTCADPDVVSAGPDLDGDLLPNQNWLGARTTIQRWYADPLLERSWDGGLGTVFTHDHYGPSTHQQVGLYSTLLIEPENSTWKHNEYAYELGTRADGGPTTWQARILIPQSGWVDLDGDDIADDPSHREFYFEFADFQHAYERGGGALGSLPNNGDGTGIAIDSYADFPNAINPSFKQPPPLLEDIYIHPNWCPGTTFNPDGTIANLVPRPCPEAISADDPGTYAVNFRNEPIALRVFEDANLNGALDLGEDLNDNGVLDQVIGDAGDLALAFQSRTDRAIPELNVQPESFIPPGEVDPISPYPPLTADVRPGDPWTPLLRAYMGDRLRIRVQVGAHEEEHNFTLHGMKWRQEAHGANSGWKNSEFFGIDEYFNVDTPVLPDTGTGTPAQVDYFYTVGSEVEGIWNGVWGILRTYKAERTDLVELPNNNVGRNGLEIVNSAEFNGICRADAPLKSFNVTAVRAEDVLPGGALVYNSRNTVVDLVTGLDANGNPTTTLQGTGPLIDPTALMYVLDSDLTYDLVTGLPNGLQPGAPIEPLILRVNAGDCVQVQLTNALPATAETVDAQGNVITGWTGQPDMPGFSAFPPIAHKNEDADGAGGITTFNYNDMIPSSYVGLHPQLLAFDPRNNDGFTGGVSDGKLVAPGDSERYTWYAGDVRATYVDTVQGGRTAQYVLSATPVEFGAAGLFPADRVKGSSKGLVGAIIVEPQNSCWVTDPGTRTQASVWKAGGLSGECVGTQGGPLTATYRDFVTIMHNDVNLRYGGGVVQIPDGLGGFIAHDCAGDPSPIQCAVPNISAEGPLGPPEDPQDSGQKAINYGADPLWFRLGIAPSTPFGLIHRNAALQNLIPDVFSNFLAGVNGDPQTEVYAASPLGPQEGRVRLLMPGGHARGTTYTLHGHEWQRQPYINGSSEIGDNTDPGSEYYGTQEGINPAGHWDIVTDLGGYFDIEGDYLWRDQASFGSYQGLWGLLRFNYTPPKAELDFYSVREAETSTVAAPGVLANDLDLDGDVLTVGTVNGDAVNVGSPIVLASSANTLTVSSDGSFTYEAAIGFFGVDSFTYEARAGGELSNEVTVTINVIANNPPVANDDVGFTVVNVPVTIDVLANDNDADGDPLTIVGSTTPASGTVDCSSGIDCIYTPGPDFVGTDSFVYTIDDAHGGQDTATVEVVVTDIIVTVARYNDSSRRWLIQGSGRPGATITAYNGACDPDGSTGGLLPMCDPADVIGTSPVDTLGAWSINERAPAPTDGQVTIVSSTGTFTVVDVEIQ